MKCSQNDTLAKSLYCVFERENFGELSILLHFNALTMFGQENFGKLMDNRQIFQCFPCHCLHYTVITTDIVIINTEIS